MIEVNDTDVNALTPLNNKENGIELLTEAVPRFKDGLKHTISFTLHVTCLRDALV